MTFFLVIDFVLRIFPFFSHIFRMFTMLNVVYDHFLTRKPPFFTLLILSRTSDNTASQNIGETNAWAVPPPQILGGNVPPVPPRSPPLYLTHACMHAMDTACRGCSSLRSMERGVSLLPVLQLARLVHSRCLAPLFGMVFHLH